MKITTRGRYAVRILARLASQTDGRYIPLGELAVAEGISKKYLEQIFPLLTKAEIVETCRGTQGGYRLAGKPESFTVGQVLRLTEGEISPAVCFQRGAGECPNRDCAGLPVWQGLNDVVYKYLDGITLADLVEKK